MRKLSLFTIVTALALFIMACGSEGKKKETKPAAEEKQTEADVSQEMEEESNVMDEIVLPSPLQIASIFKRSGMKYQGGLTNPTENISNYSSRKKRTLNLGTYSADLAYCVINDQSQEALNYMKNVRQLSEDLGMSTLFNSEALFKSFENNLGNEDSLIYILATVQEKMDEYIEDNDKQHMSAVIFAGAWTEAMYIGAQTTDSHSSKLSMRLVEQMTILENLIKGLESDPHKDDISEVLASLKEIHKYYKGIPSVQKNLSEGNYALEDFSLTEKEFKELSAKIATAREKVINS